MPPVHRYAYVAAMIYRANRSAVAGTLANAVSGVAAAIMTAFAYALDGAGPADAAGPCGRVLYGELADASWRLFVGGFCSRCSIVWLKL